MTARTAVGVVLALTVSRAPVVAATDATAQEVADRYDRGVRLVLDGDYGGAVAEFRRVCELAPDKKAFYNLARVYARLNRPVEALDALEHLGSVPGELSPTKESLARTTREEQLRRIATLTIESNAAATIELDGIEVGRTPLARALRVAAGAHVLALLAPGYIPVHREITVAGERTESLRVELIRTEIKAAHLVISTRLPGVSVLVDGQLMGSTPLPASLTVAPGQHTIELRRRGYSPARLDLSLGEGATGDVRNDLEQDPGLSPADLGHLLLSASEDEANLTVDDRPQGVYRDSLRLPVGPHRLRIERSGFEPIERLVEIAGQDVVRVRVTLRPTPEARLVYVERAQAWRRWGLASVLVGAGMAAGAAGFIAANQPPLDRAVNQRDQVDATFLMNQPCWNSGGGDHKACAREQAEAYQKVTDLELRRTLAIVGGGVGLLVAGVGTYLLFRGDDPERYDRPGGEVALSPWVARGLAGLVAGARF
jgi:hypothetical protein